MEVQELTNTIYNMRTPSQGIIEVSAAKSVIPGGGGRSMAQRMNEEDAESKQEDERGERMS